MKGFKIFLVLFILGGLVSTYGFSEIYCKIKGRVIDAETREGIPDVYVNAHLFRHDSPEEFYVFTDEKGYFTFSNMIPGRYVLSYNPLYPYVRFPDQEQLLIKWEDSFVLEKGEVKYVEQKLLKGGEIIADFNIPNGDLNEYEEVNYYLDRIEGNEIKKNILIVQHQFYNPRFKSVSSGKKFSGIALGEYILCWSFKKRPEYSSENDVDYAGVIKVFTLNKLESIVLDVDYNSKSKIILDIKDKDGNKFHSGSIYIRKEISIKGISYFYKVWGYSYDPDRTLKPIVLEPGKYNIDIYFGGELIRKDGTIIEFEKNEFLVDINEDQAQTLKLIVSISGKSVPELDDIGYIR